jgi:hypothetical protein
MIVHPKGIMTSSVALAFTFTTEITNAACTFVALPHKIGYPAINDVGMNLFIVRKLVE